MKGKKKRKDHRPQPTIQRQRQKHDEHQLCRNAPKCRNVVATWASRSGLCARCRSER